MEMDKGQQPGGTLMPDQHQLELYVTLTDFYGYYRGVPTYDPVRVKDRRHRHVLVFSYSDVKDQLNDDWNSELAFAARATSCFPGAFPPINLANIRENVPDWEGSQRFKDEFWSIYPLSDADVERTHFVDGGVLDNFPFRHAVDAVRSRPASLEVDRRLIYIEPHPAAMKEPPEGSSPSVRATVTGGLSALPRHEPILDDLLELRRFNDRVERVNDVIEAAASEIFDLADVPLEAAGYAAARDTAMEAANTGFAYATYTELEAALGRRALRRAGVRGLSLPAGLEPRLLRHGRADRVGGPPGPPEASDQAQRGPDRVPEGLRPGVRGTTPSLRDPVRELALRGGGRARQPQRGEGAPLRPDRRAATGRRRRRSGQARRSGPRPLRPQGAERADRQREEAGRGGPRVRRRARRGPRPDARRAEDVLRRAPRGLRRERIQGAAEGDSRLAEGGPRGRARHDTSASRSGTC